MSTATKKPKNSNLQLAKENKNDEFYTKISDIEEELRHYRWHFKGKVVFCNCDDPEFSNFYKYFYLNFEFLGLKKLITTHYEKGSSSYKIEYLGHSSQATQTPLKGDGDFGSEECVKILKESDIVVTNPPFSLFAEYVDVLIKNNKDFLIIGPLGAVSYKNFSQLLKDNKAWLGVNSVKEFDQPDGTVKKFGNIIWFTNLAHHKQNKELILWKTYKGNEQDYPKLDNFDAIFVDKVVNIPVDYEDLMCVPISFVQHLNPNQFRVIGNEYDLKVSNGRFYLKNKRLFPKLVIAKKK